jgi:hypothetical protein
MKPVLRSRSYLDDLDDIERYLSQKTTRGLAQTCGCILTSKWIN